MINGKVIFSVFLVYGTESKRLQSKGMATEIGKLMEN